MSAPTSTPILKGIMTGLLRYTTDWFINDTATIAGPVAIALQRQVAVDKPGGGRDFTTVTLPIQTFRLTNQTVTDGISYSNNDEGMARRDEYVLIGQWDADVQANDTWEDATGKWKVNGIVPNTGYETRANVTAFTSDPDYGS
jgi:hypothetical protein